mgnify:FL=1
MLELNSFKGKHKGEDVYVIGSGPSCDYIDPSFITNKITIGTNQTYRRYQTNYILRKEHKLLQDTLNNFNGPVFVSKGNCGTLHSVINLDKYKHNDRICVYNHLNNALKINLKAFDMPDHLCVSHSTITTSIHLAYYMGAKNIILIGVDHGCLDGKQTFKDYYKDIKETAWNDWQQYKGWLKNLDNDTTKIKTKLSSLGVNVYSINPFINFRLEGHKYE